MKRSLSVAILFLTIYTAFAQQYSFRKSELSSEERAKDLISRLTL